MGTVIIIPARFPSQRFPGKPLQPLRGATGVAKTLLQRTHDVALRVPGIDAVYIATDDERIAEHADTFGAKVLMTSDQCRNGTERCEDSLDKLPSEPDLVVNLQGDAPLTPAHFVTELIDGIGDAAVATPALLCDDETLSRFRQDRAAGRVGGTTAVMTRAGRALYFSKEVIPYVADDKPAPPVYHHVGLYAYRPAALRQYVGFEPGPLETHEGLEQLRFLENGIDVQCVTVESRQSMFWEVNNPEDVPRVEAALAKLGIE
ncbi:3-deoxy-manno-octulosonate cytidylyltransferase [Acuticoccus sediminis]|uniref:3-deoxy-manno-octulosonate cytidylyltransferase n=1 Tax=Acuticoccus sediminis TaxID=2184697 RepID=A0A8B2NFF0_9HYPH|nr:manno-octulosonate cytidylyltransferase [Acuticoccus sediminis]RAH97728.1 3-deoxy-manno-octulosonate cytidylyltransferase [Acuticoccus sediminis]